MKCSILSHHTAWSVLSCPTILHEVFYHLPPYCMKCSIISHHTAWSVLSSPTTLHEVFYHLPPYCMKCSIISHHTAWSVLSSPTILHEVHPLHFRHSYRLEAALVWKAFNILGIFYLFGTFLEFVPAMKAPCEVSCLFILESKDKFSWWIRLLDP